MLYKLIQERCKLYLLEHMKPNAQLTTEALKLELIRLIVNATSANVHDLAEKLTDKRIHNW